MEVLDATGLADRLRWEDKEYWLHLEAGSPLEKYPAKQHARRVQEKLGADEGLIYLPGQPAKNNDDSDMPAPFRQLRYFYYLSGCNEPGCYLTYDIRSDTLSLFIPRIKPERVIWNGRGSTPAEALIKYDIDNVFFVDQLEAFIQDWAAEDCNQDTTIYVLHQSSRVPGYHKLDPRIHSTALRPAMNISRMVKDDHEIKLIRKANDISSQAHREVLANILKFKNEAQVEGLFMDVCISNHAKEQAYNPIAASGPNAGTLHYDANNEDLAGRQLMCLDAGCEYELYASDVTRTFPLSSSWPTEEAENIYKLVERMQETCIERLAPGVRYLDLHILAHQIAIDGLLQLGILHNGSKEEIYKAGTSKAFFPHGLGHHMGLEVHDVGQAELMSVRRGKPIYQQAPSLYPENFHSPIYDANTCLAPTDPQSSHLEEGMVITVEPGIYFSVYALQHFYLPSPIHSKFINLEVLKRYLPVGGVRIEDDILITAKGYENLTTAPKGDEMLDVIKRGKSSGQAGPVPVSRPSRRQSMEVETPLLRAPGISRNMSRPVQKSPARASTMPAGLSQQDDVDFEPFAGPSLFESFSRSMTTEQKIQQWHKEHRPGPFVQRLSENARQSPPVCGKLDPNVEHTYMSTAGQMPPTHRGSRMILPMCKNCLILTQALDRLRHNLTLSVQNSPRQEDMPVFETPARCLNSENGHRATTLMNSQAREAAAGQPVPPPAAPKWLGQEMPKPDLGSLVAGLRSPIDGSSRRQSPSHSPILPPAHTLNERIVPIPLRHKPSTNNDTMDMQIDSPPPTANSSLSKRTNQPGRSTPLQVAEEVEATRQKLDALRTRLESLEASAHHTKSDHHQQSYPHRPAHPRPSLPNLMSHSNPWQQQHSARSRAQERTSRNSANLEVIMRDAERMVQREREERTKREDFDGRE